jgi:hypothetical protein
MTESQNPETKPGPANPQAEGVEAPTPPEGPLRQDKAEGGLPGGHDDEVSGSATANKHASESGGHTIPIDEEQPHPEDEPARGGDTLQFENAETSLDQPSEG